MLNAEVFNELVLYFESKLQRGLVDKEVEFLKFLAEKMSEEKS